MDLLILLARVIGCLVALAGVLMLARPKTILDLARWSVAAPRFWWISAIRVAAGVMFENRSGTAKGSFEGEIDTLDVTILNVDPDNFGSYGGDGLDDAWQVQFFGEDNPLAAPAQDPDADEQDNAFEYIAGTDPGDRDSFFDVSMESVSAEPSKVKIIFEPLVSGRSYTVMTSDTLLPGSWGELPGATSDDDGDVRTVTDHSAGGMRRFYRVEITKP